MIEAQVICDSISPQNHRLTTFKLRYPRFIHAECATHRLVSQHGVATEEFVDNYGFMDAKDISRNASSSRAIPFAKQVQQVRDDATRAAPVYWGAEQKGMQTGEELSNVKQDLLNVGYDNLPFVNASPRDAAVAIWRMAALSAARMAEYMAELGLHKSICNRVIEPYTHITVIASATDAGWMNFFGLRLDAAAEPTMRALAVAMWKAYQASEPQLLQPGQWHLPFVLVRYSDKEDGMIFKGDADEWTTFLKMPVEEREATLIKISVARCARVSYESFDTGKRSTIEEDLKLYDRLVGAQPLHASPAEHQATPDEWFTEAANNMPMMNVRNSWIRDNGVCWANPHQHGNFTGWRQYRKMLPGESLAPLPVEYAAQIHTPDL